MYIDGPGQPHPCIPDRPAPHGPSERCCAPEPVCHETFSEHLMRSRSRGGDVCKISCDPTPRPFGEYLRCVNDDDRRTRTTDALFIQNAAPMHMEPARGDRSPLAFPKIGEVSPVVRTEQTVRLERVYQVRSTLSRGAMIDLMG